VGEIARLRAALVQGGELGEKRINNILAVVSKPLKYAAECKVIASAPKVGLFKVERPEIVAWDFAQYARLLAAAQVESPTWYVASAWPVKPASGLARSRRFAGVKTST
jgi:hypothetical protein